MAGQIKRPKSECCSSKPRCNRCPIRMLEEGTLPPGYAVRKRKLVRIDELGNELSGASEKRRKRHPWVLRLPDRSSRAVGA